MLNKVIKAVEGKKTIIGAAMLALAYAPIGLPIGAAYGLSLVGSALGGAGLFDKARRSVNK